MSQIWSRNIWRILPVIPLTTLSKSSIIQCRKIGPRTKKWSITMKKQLIKLLSLTLLSTAILTGCTRNHTNNPTASSTPQVTESSKPSSQPETTEKADTAGKPTTEPVNTEEAPAGEMLSDPNMITALAKAVLSNMTLEEKVGQMFIVNLESLDESKGSFYEHRKVTKKMKKNLKDFPVGGVILFSRNIETREQTMKLNEALQANSTVPLWISVDEEGGDVARIANNPNMKTTVFPSMELVGASEDADYCYDMGKTIGSEIKELGFNLDFAPVADVRTNENNTEIGNRSFGNDAKMVAEYASAVVKGIQSENVSATLKHFPGHGDAQGDTHKQSVNIGSDINRLRNVDFVPFKEGIKAGADFIMISHISISRVAGNTLPASLSPLVMQDIVRDELGFKGVIVTDAMDMKAITDNYSSAEATMKAIRAGADVVLMPSNFTHAYNTVVNAVITDDISESRINDSVQKILEAKIRRGLILSDSQLIYKDEK